MGKMLRILAAVVVAGVMAMGQPPTAAKSGKAAPKQSVSTADQCTAMTQSGTRCKRKAQPGTKFCWQHDPANKGKKKKS